MPSFNILRGHRPSQPARRWLWFVAGTVLLTMSLAGGLAQAAMPGQLAQAPTQPAGREISPMQAAEIAKSRNGGKVLKISREGSIYRIKLLLPSGTVKTVIVDANGN